MPITAKGLAAAGALAFGLALAGGPVQAQPQSITMATGGTGGSWYPIGAGFAKIFNDNGVLANSEPGGAISNIINVANGQFEIGFSMAALLGMAAQGEEPFPEPVDSVRALAVFGDSFTHVLVRRDAGIDGIADLRGQRFGSFQPGSMGALAFAHLLRAAGMSEDDLTLFRGSQSYQGDQIRDRRTVGGTSSSAFPSGTWVELMTSIDMKLLPVDDALFAQLLEVNPGYSRAVLPAGTYPGQDEDVPGVGTVSILVVSAEMADDDAYWIARTMHENLDAIREIHGSLRGLTPEILADVGGVPLHPGAERYWREAGLID